MALSAVSCGAPLATPTDGTGGRDDARALTDSLSSSGDWLVTAKDSRPTAPIADAATDSSPVMPLRPAPHLAWPQVTFQGGHVLAPLRVVTVSTKADPLASQHAAFGSALPQSHWFASFAADYSLGSPRSSMSVTGPALATTTTTMNEAAMSAYVTNAAFGVAPPDGNTVYVLYLPAGVSIVETSGAVNTNCQLQDGNHIPIGTLGDDLAFIQQCPLTYQTNALDQATFTASHEIAEAATDPTYAGWGLWSPASGVPNGSPWAAIQGLNHAEVGDLCEGSEIREGGFLYQRIYGNSAAGMGGDPCVPALSAPYYNVSPDQAFYAASAGASVSITFTGWSTAPAADWVVGSTDKQSQSDASLTFATTSTSATNTTIASGPFAGTWKTSNNGRTFTLTVDVPAGAPSGAWAVFAYHSHLLDGSGQLIPGDDYYHRAAVGVYVP
jgi:hypothetical protein